MSVMDKKYINVLNCEENVVIVPTTNGRCYTFEPGSLDEPCVLPIPSEEVRYINSISKCFKNGVLRFENDEAIENVLNRIGKDEGILRAGWNIINE